MKKLLLLVTAIIMIGGCVYYPGDYGYYDSNYYPYPYAYTRPYINLNYSHIYGGRDYYYGGWPSYYYGWPGYYYGESGYYRGGSSYNRGGSGGLHR